MAYIYLITNDINNKQYVGKTEHATILDRWKEHCNDYKLYKNNSRPLYKAMKKYGIEHFYIEEIEKVPPNVNLDEREKFWINFYDTYKHGYNATLGGDGKLRLDYHLIKQLWDSGLSCSQISKQLSCDPDWIGVILKKFDISTDEIIKHGNDSMSIKVYQIDKDTSEIIHIYNSMREAAQCMIEQGYTKCKVGTGSTHISEVCNGKRKTFAGFKWQKIL